MGAAGLIVGGAAALGGSVVSAVSSVNAAGAQYNAKMEELNLRRLEADELLNREAINESVMQARGDIMKNQYEAAYAASGKGGGALGGLLRIQADINQNMAISRREAEFKAQQLRAGADISQELAGAGKTAAWWNAAGTLLTGGANAANLISRINFGGGKPDGKSIPKGQYNGGSTTGLEGFDTGSLQPRDVLSVWGR